MYLAVQGPDRDVELSREVLGAAELLGAAPQQLAHPPHQEPVAPVLEHGQRQRALQHQLKGALVALQRQREVLRVEGEGGLRGAEDDRPREQQRVDVRVRRGREREAGFDQRDPRVDRPAGVAVHVPEERDEAELPQITEAAALGDREGHDRSRRRQPQHDVVGQDSVVPAPALERDAEGRGGDRGAAQHAVAAPREPAREPAERLVVELLHGRLADGLHLPSGDPAQRILEQRRRDLCRPQGPAGIHAMALEPSDDGADEGHRRRGGVGETLAMTRVRPHAPRASPGVGTICNPFGGQ